MIGPGSVSPAELAAAFDAEQRALAVHKADTERAIRRKYSGLISLAPTEYVLAFAHTLLFTLSLIHI